MILAPHHRYTRSDDADGRYNYVCYYMESLLPLAGSCIFRLIHLRSSRHPAALALILCDAVLKWLDPILVYLSLMLIDLDRHIYRVRGRGGLVPMLSLSALSMMC